MAKKGPSRKSGAAAGHDRGTGAARTESMTAHHRAASTLRDQAENRLRIQLSLKTTAKASR